MNHVVRMNRETTQAIDTAAVQHRTLWVLAISTVLGGLGIGASVSVGALLLAEVSQNEAISGLASTMSAAGAAVAGIPLARMAAKRGRRSALILGNLIAMLGGALAVLAAVIGAPILLLLALAMLGVATAVQLLARFAATDLAVPKQQARDLSLVVWSITVGAVAGPNLTAPGSAIGDFLGIPSLSGVFAFTILAQGAAAIVVWAWLRPDPLLLSRELAETPSEQAVPHETPERTDRPAQVLTIVAVAVAHAVMVAIMAMTPLHIMHHDGTPAIVGLTISLHIAGMFALAPVFGFLASRFGRVPVITLGNIMLLMSTALAFVAGASHLLVQASLILLGLGWSAVTVAGAALITEVTLRRDRPKIQGVTDTAMNGAGAIAGALAGVVFAVGNFPLLAIASTVLLLIGIVATGALSMRGRRMGRTLD